MDGFDGDFLNDNDDFFDGIDDIIDILDHAGNEGREFRDDEQDVDQDFDQQVPTELFRSISMEDDYQDDDQSEYDDQDGSQDQSEYEYDDPRRLEQLQQQYPVIDMDEQHQQFSGFFHANDEIVPYEADEYSGPLFTRDGDAPILDQWGEEEFRGYDYSGEYIEEANDGDKIRFFLENHREHDASLDMFSRITDEDRTIRYDGQPPPVRDEKLEQLFRMMEKFFPDLEVGYYGRDGDMHITIEPLRNGNHMVDIKLCIYVEEDGTREFCIYIEFLFKGTFSGPECIERIQMLARCCEIKYVMLQDESSRKLTIEEDDTEHYRSMNLAICTIITSGQSWYNGLGFKQSSYQMEKRAWDTIVRSRVSFNQIIVMLYAMDYHVYDKKRLLNWYDDGYSILAAYYQFNRYRMRSLPNISDYDLVDENSYIHVRRNSIRQIIDYFQNDDVDVQIVDRPLTDVCCEFYIEMKEPSNMEIQDYDYKYAFISICGYIFPYYRHHMVKKLFS